MRTIGKREDKRGVRSKEMTSHGCRSTFKCQQRRDYKIHNGWEEDVSKRHFFQEKKIKIWTRSPRVCKILHPVIMDQKYEEALTKCHNTMACRVYHDARDF